MPISIKNTEVEHLARTLAAESGESLTQALRHALEDRLERLRGCKRAPSTFEAIMELSRRSGALPDKDTRSPEEILGYREDGTFG